MNQHLKSILVGCARQSRESQKALYRKFYPYAMSIAVRYIKDQQVAEQAVNDSYMKVFKNVDKFDSNKPFKPWFRQILVNTSIDHLNQKKKLKMNTDLSDANQVPDREDIISNISYQELIALVHSLSDAYKTIFNMYVIDGFKHEEISNILGISVGTSKSNLSKARKNLKTMITQQIKTNQLG